jgi:Rrf2 family protein
MKVSLRATYGIMAAVDIAMHLGTAPVQAKSIARRQVIPARFLEQVLHGMKKAGLVSSIRGARAGTYFEETVRGIVVEILRHLMVRFHSRTVAERGRAQGRRLSKPELCLGRFGSRSIKRNAMCSKP